MDSDSSFNLNDFIGSVITAAPGIITATKGNNKPATQTQAVPVTTDKNELPSWVLPAAGIAVGGLILAFVIAQSRR
jgi:hypothetical protein